MSRVEYPRLRLDGVEPLPVAAPAEADALGRDPYA
jgi:hypothetical protein